MSSSVPAPEGQVLSLVAALSNTQNHDLHVQAIRARDEALSSTPESYGHLCAQLSFLLAGSDQPNDMLAKIPREQLQHFTSSDPQTFKQLCENLQHWTVFGQMAGLILKQALLRPPILPDGRPLCLMSPASDQVKQVLLVCLGCAKPELRNVASTILSTTAVSSDSIQPALAVQAWPQLIDTLLSNLHQTENTNLVEGSLATIRKIMEDGPKELSEEQLDSLIPILIQFASSNYDKVKTSSLQAIVACLTAGLMPSALVAHFNDYLTCLSNLTNDQSPVVRKWVCRSIVTILNMRTEYLQAHLEAICQFMCSCTADLRHPDVALEACEFWLTFASLGNDACTPDMITQVAQLLPQLIPLLLRGMVYLPEQQEELKFRNQLDAQGNHKDENKPVFHRIKPKRVTDDEEDDDDDDEDFDDDEGNTWTLRKCCAASLDCLAGLYGPDGILPPLLPALQEGLSNNDPWAQEASILALGAISEGCADAMEAHLPQLHPYLMNHLKTPESPEALPQIKCIAAWTIGRYAEWAVSQVQSGAQGHLVAEMTEVFLTRLGDQNRKSQIACCSAFGVVIETAGDLMVPYLEHIFKGLIGALTRYQGRSLLIVFDVLGIAADYVGGPIGEGNLPSLYVPTLVQMWDTVAKNDPTDKTLVPLLESLASISLACGTNYQPYALPTFENAMSTIEAVTLHFTGSGERFEHEEDADVIVCAADVIDGLVEGFGPNFSILVSSSTRYGHVFTNVLKGLCGHEVPGVRMSAFAILGDLARNSPEVLESALPELLKEAVANLDPTHASVYNNAIWSIGEICVKCQGNPGPLGRIAPDLVQCIIAMLMGQSDFAVSGLAENTAAAAGRLALVDPNFVAADLPRFLLGWCDGLAKISDPDERRDGFWGLIKSLYANPGAIQTAGNSPADAISSFLFAVVSWHVPEDYDQGQQGGFEAMMFQPFPQTEHELEAALGKLLLDIKTSVGESVWQSVEKNMPVNVRRLIREAYRL